MVTRYTCTGKIIRPQIIRPQSFPALTSGFEIETELAVHALQLRLPLAELPTPYQARPPASSSKLRTVRDGLRISHLIARLVREERPLESFTILAALLALASFVLFGTILSEYLRTGLVPRFPSLILSVGLMLLAFLSFSCGLILATVTRGRIEVKRLHYLSVPLRLPDSRRGHGRIADEGDEAWRTGRAVGNPMQAETRGSLRENEDR